MAASRLSGKVTMIGRAGRDGFGDVACNNLGANGVDISGVEHDRQTRPASP